MTPEEAQANFISSEWVKSINGKLEELGILGNKQLNVWANEKYQLVELNQELKLAVLPPRVVVDPATGQQVVWWACRQMPPGVRLTPLSGQPEASPPEGQ